MLPVAGRKVLGDSQRPRTAPTLGSSASCPGLTSACPYVTASPVYVCGAAGRIICGALQSSATVGGEWPREAGEREQGGCSQGEAGIEGHSGHPDL